MSAEAPVGRERASESVATRFTRVMNATTSPRGWLGDLPLASMVSAIPLVMIVRQAAGGDLASSTTVVLLAIALIPIAIAIGVGLSLRNGRDEVIGWLASLPFPVENMNSLLAGISDVIVVQLAPGVAVPEREELQRLVDPISDDTLATLVEPEERQATFQIGVVDHKQLPLRSNHQRYVRLQRIVAEVLIPLHRRLPIEQVRVV